MRVILAIATGLAFFATAAAAQTVPDRYGPPRAGVQTASAAQAMAYGGRMLSWASKVEPAPAASRPPEPAAAQAQAPQPRRELMASRAYTLGEIEQAPEPQPAYAAAPPARPASLYDTPAPRTAAAAPQPAPAAPAPVRLAAAPTASPMAAPGGGAPTRLYSLHREYGMAPDPTPQVPAGERYVLVGPPDAPQPAPDAAKADDGQDRPF